MDYSQELTDIRTILVAGLDPALIAWPGEGFTPPDPTGDPANPSKWYDVDLRDLGKLTNQATQQLTYGGDRAREMRLEVGICFELGTGADASARAEAEALENLFDDNDTATMVYRWRESSLTEGRVWQESWWLVPWVIPIERYE